eukprot:scaffold12713_cov112-Isochrysis_galbana.AAC.2
MGRWAREECRDGRRERERALEEWMGAKGESVWAERGRARLRGEYAGVEECDRREGGGVVMGWMNGEADRQCAGKARCEAAQWPASVRAIRMCGLGSRC